MSAHSNETVKPPLVLEASLDQTSIDLDTELRPHVSLINASEKPVKVEYLRGSAVVPEIWDRSNNTRCLNAPTFVFSQICAREETLLAPKASLTLNSLPIYFGKKSPPDSKVNYTRAFWATLPGSFALKYSVNLRDFLPGTAGELHAPNINITISDPSKKLLGQLFFEPGKGYYVAMGTKGGKGTAWLLPSENKLLVRQLDKLVGSQISVQGRLQRMDPHSRGTVPPGELYMTGLKILDQTNNQKPACLLTLSKAGKFYGPTTSKSGPSSVQKAYVDATGRVASFETDDLNWLLQHGTPAGRLYGAILLWQTGRIGPNLSYEKLINDDSEVEYQSGCEVSKASVKGIAQSLMDSGKFMDFQTGSQFCKLKAPLK